MKLIDSGNCSLETVEIKGKHTTILFDTTTFEDGTVEKMVTIGDSFDGKFYMKGGEIDDFIHNFQTFIQVYTGEKYEPNEKDTGL